MIISLSDHIWHLQKSHKMYFTRFSLICCLLIFYMCKPKCTSSIINIEDHYPHHMFFFFTHPILKVQYHIWLWESDPCRLHTPNCIFEPLNEQEKLQMFVISFDFNRFENKKSHKPGRYFTEEKKSLRIKPLQLFGHLPERRHTSLLTAEHFVPV